MTTTTTTTNNSSTGSAVVSALELVWNEIRHRHPEVPPAVIITGSGLSSFGLVRGHYRPSGWQAATGNQVEIFVSGERIADGIACVLTTMLHEAAHAVAAVRGVKDTSRGNRYHNRRFVEIAEELGLQAPAKPHPSIGWSDCKLAEGTLRSYVNVLDHYEQLAAWIAYPKFLFGNLPNGGDGEGVKVRRPGRSGKSGSIRTAYVCDCGRKLRMTASVFREGPITCGNCGGDFVEEMAA